MNPIDCPRCHGMAMPGVLPAPRLECDNCGATFVVTAVQHAFAAAVVADEERKRVLR